MKAVESIKKEREFIMAYKAAIFDMDGTTLNTLGDLTVAMNWALEQTGHRHDFDENMVRQFFGSGVKVAVQRALATENGMPQEQLVLIGQEGHEEVDGVDEAEVERVSEVYKPYYAARCDIKTGPYPGILDLLKDLKVAGVKCAVVSNKPDEAVQKLVEDDFEGLFDVCLGEREGIRRKPAPDMTLWTLEQLGVDRKDAVYIGDSEIDMMTGANSGMDCISVDWGFRSRAFLEAHHATRIVSDAAELEQAILG